MVQYTTRARVPHHILSHHITCWRDTDRMSHTFTKDHAGGIDGGDVSQNARSQPETIVSGPGARPYEMAQTTSRISTARRLDDSVGKNTYQHSDQEPTEDLTRIANTTKVKGGSHCLQSCWILGQQPRNGVYQKIQVPKLNRLYGHSTHLPIFS